MRRLTATFAATAAIALFATGCNAQTSAADGATEQVCSAMGQAQSAISGLTENPPTTVAQAQEQLGQVTENVNAAKGEASGLAQAILVNLSSSLSASGKTLDGLAPDAALPSGFTGTVNSVQEKFTEVNDKLKCGQ